MDMGQDGALMTKLNWPTVALIAVLGMVAIGLASIAHWGSGEILGLLGILGGIGGGAAVAGGVAGKVEQVHTETAAQTQTLAKIDHQTNGQLAARDQRIADLEDRLRRLGGDL
jgi:hypothetical protein